MEDALQALNDNGGDVEGAMAQLFESNINTTSETEATVRAAHKAEKGKIHLSWFISMM